MRLSCLPVSLFPDFASGKYDIASWGVEARRIGFDGFDISAMFIKNHTPAYLTELRKNIDSAGIPLVMTCVYPDFTHPDALQRARGSLSRERHRGRLRTRRQIPPRPRRAGAPRSDPR